MRYPASVLLILVMALTACGHPLIPALGHGTAKSRPQPYIGSSGPVVGVDLYALSNYPAAEVRADGQRVLSYIRNVLNADAVGIVWNFFADSDQADAVRTTNETLSASNVAILTNLARQYHLQVEYRPVVYVNGPDHWARLISPAHRKQWFDSYFHAELPYLRTAQRLGVEEFVTETEMHDLYSGRLWDPFFKRAATVYHGVVSYADWDGDYFGTEPGSPVEAGLPGTHFLPAKYLGLDMYWRLRLRPGAPQPAVTRAWERLFSKAPAAVLRRTAIDETGIQARAGAYLNPAGLGLPGHALGIVQARWFRAACETVRHFHMRGLFFWKVDLTDNPSHPARSLSTFEGRQGAAAISDCTNILS
jgi:hypothetical protein